MLELQRALALISASATELFGRMLASEIEIDASELDSVPLVHSEVSSVVIFRGDFHGCLSLHCTRLQADEFTRRLLSISGDTVPSSQDVRSTIAELAGIIAGGFRSQLSGELWIESSLPLVFASPHIELRIEGGVGWILPIRDTSGPFQIELTTLPDDAQSAVHTDQ